MKKIIGKFRWLSYFPLWIGILAGFFGLNFIKCVWVTIKKTKAARKIIYSDFVQTWKEKLTGRPKITTKQYEDSDTAR